MTSQYIVSLHARKTCTKTQNDICAKMPHIFASNTPLWIIKKRANAVPKIKKKRKKLRDYSEKKKSRLGFRKLLGLSIIRRTLSLALTENWGRTVQILNPRTFNVWIKLKPSPFLRMFDIIKDLKFYSFNNGLKPTMDKFNIEGKSDVEHYPSIEDDI